MQRRRRSSAPLLLLLAALAASCGGEESHPAGIVIHAGNNQTAAPGERVPIAPAVLVRDSDGSPVANHPVTFFVTSGGGSVEGAETRTSAQGIATVGSWTLGSREGEHTLAAAAGTLGPVIFRAWTVDLPRDPGVVNPDFGMDLGTFGHEEGPFGWTLLFTGEAEGAQAEVEASQLAESGHVLRFAELSRHFGDSRLEQCVPVSDPAARFALSARVATPVPDDALRVRLNVEFYGRSEECEADSSSARIEERLRSDHPLGPQEGVEPDAWQTVSTEVREPPVSPPQELWARVSLRARDRTGDQNPSAPPAVLLVDRVELVLVGAPQAMTGAPTFLPVDEGRRQRVEIRSRTPGATIRYTLDGTVPTPERGRIYDGPVRLRPHEQIRAIAYGSEGDPSPITDALHSTLFAPLVELPQVHVHTYAVPIDNREVRVPARVVLREGTRESHSPVELFSGRGGIRGRGNSSWKKFPKKSFNLELWDHAAKGVDVPVLGMPAEEDWLLIANYADKSLMRNHLAYELSRRLGHDWAPRTRFVDLYLNGDYEGTYLVTERIKRGDDRVKLDSPTENDHSGGYLAEIMPTTRVTDEITIQPSRSRLTVAIKYPNDPTPAQQAYLASYLDAFEEALHRRDYSEETGYPRYIDVDAFIDWLLVNEVARNVDAAFVASVFLHKPRGGKLRMGPVWDFDIGFGNADYEDGWLTDGWRVAGSGWYLRLFEDPAFRARVRERWTEVRAIVGELPRMVDQTAASLRPAARRNFSRWPIIGKRVWPNPEPVPQTWQEEIGALRRWIDARLAWMDDAIAGLEGPPPRQ